jgi:pimeloyl-ACP methyl ester carboxylesterase
VLCGRQDVLTSYPQSERIARRLPTAELVLLEECGHFVWHDQPERFFSTIRRFLADEV